MTDAPVSTQKEFTGQQGWNDCMPDAMMQGSKPRAGPRKVRRADDGGLYSGQPPVATTASPNSSQTTLPPTGPPKKPSTTPPMGSVAPAKPMTPPTAIEVADSLDGVVVLQQVIGLLESSKLSVKEVGQYRTKFEKVIPDLAPVHLKAIVDALAQPADARDILMKHSMVNIGTSSWCTPLRRILESQ
ncbi:hypothetical protein B9G98_04070 [Wickerhamiella sorbophila]|uniref:Uncharacterized protein n=1 Tax=Wickerhamiella sorbophila TaxID=45607 RepID=A0A2T0FN98_9ASCO|nr:hypothetical protein B9G98_04070 [Wickerhamiella sorbophila]PRT56450.1 hypothetical protein B9G98_04070 [Wickerhamiella sorbophila]